MVSLQFSDDLLCTLINAGLFLLPFLLLAALRRLCKGQPQDCPDQGLVTSDKALRFSPEMGLFDEQSAAH